MFSIKIAIFFKVKLIAKIMLMKILGIIDLMAGILLIFSAGISLPWRIYFIFGGILISKSFLGGIPQEPASIIDFFVGAALLLSILITFPWYISLILGILVIQKSIFSFF